ncbi:MAG: hypothetical protein AB1635_15785 [Acidobacteriota bacterium]
MMQCTLGALRVIRELRAENAIWRELATVAVHLLHEAHRDREAARRIAAHLREEIRRYTAAQVPGDRAA